MSPKDAPSAAVAPSALSPERPIPGDPAATPPERRRPPMARMAGDGAPPAAGALVLTPIPDLWAAGEMEAIRDRAHAYLRAGVPVHFRGPAGVGKTTLALDVAARLGRPVALLTGGDEITSGDLLGRQLGETTREIRDSYVQRVVRTESRSRAEWRDSLLAEAMERGHTLVYDEFTRSPPAANNALLSALEERVLVFANPARGARYLHAHPDFRAILTSNPDEYAGVAGAPDALVDRVVTFDLGWCSEAGETAIVAARTGLPARDAGAVVALVRGLRARTAAPNPPSTRTALTIARLLAAQGVPARPSDARYVQICLDVLGARAPRRDPAAREAYLAELRRGIVDGEDAA